MLIVVANLKDGCGQSTCAVNLACELAGVAPSAKDRWQGNSVLISMLTAKTKHYCSGGLLPVSCTHLPPQDTNIEFWIREKILSIVSHVDYVVVDSPPLLHNATKAFVDVSDLLIIPCSAADLDVTAKMMELVRSARSARADAGPKCLLVPTRVSAGSVRARKLEAELRRFNEPVGLPIHQNAAFRGAYKAKRWIGDFAPESLSHGDIRALAASVRSAIGSNEAAYSYLTAGYLTT